MGKLQPELEQQQLPLLLKLHAGLMDYQVCGMRSQQMLLLLLWARPLRL
jgi:hypothetical protein